MTTAAEAITERVRPPAREGGATETGFTLLTMFGGIAGAVAGAELGTTDPGVGGSLGVLLGSGLAAAAWGLGVLIARAVWGGGRAAGEGVEGSPMKDGGWFAELEEVDAEFRRMAAGVELALGEAVRAVLDRDRERAARVLDGEHAIDEMECRIEDRCYRILLLFHPVAGDLRRVTAVSRMTSELERIGDLAAAVAERAEALAALPPRRVPAGLAPMAGAATDLVRAALDAYSRRDPAAARRVCRSRGAVAALGDAVSGEVIEAMKADPAAVEPGLNLIAVERGLRRVADRATNLAEDAVFLAEGHSIRHHWDAGCLARAE